LAQYDEKMRVSVVTEELMSPDSFGLSDEMLIYEMMNRNMEGTIRPLRVFSLNYCLIPL
jgi:hypothetical protein